MSTINNEVLHTSLLKQFNNKKLILSSELLNKAIKQTFIEDKYSYEEIKQANGQLYKLIKDKVDIKRTKLLSMIAVALGYENHHALKSHSLKINKKAELSSNKIVNKLDQTESLDTIGSSITHKRSWSTNDVDKAEVFHEEILEKIADEVVLEMVEKGEKTATRTVKIGESNYEGSFSEI